MPGGAAQDLWVFAYGSLMWQPGFPFAEARHARLTGFRRALCIYSVHYRGTAKRPGLVLGLDRGGACEGVAFRVEPEAAAGVLAYLRKRELIYPVYRESLLSVTLVTGRRPEVMALTYIAERHHPSYAGTLPLATQARLLRGASGSTGTNIDYLANTLRHLDELGISEPRLKRLMSVIGAFACGGRHTAVQNESPRAGRGRAEALVRAFASRPVPAPFLTTEEQSRFSHRRFLNARSRIALATAPFIGP